MSIKPTNQKNKDHSGDQNKAPGFCLQLGSAFCKEQCPNQCYDRFQQMVAGLFATDLDHTGDKSPSR